MKKNTGFTLVELLVGTGIFMVVFMGGMAGLRYSSALNSSQTEMSIVNSILTYIAEDIKDTDFASLNPGSPSAIDDAYNFGGSKVHSFLSELNNPNVVINITEPDGAGEGIKKIVIVLSWQGSVGTSYPQTLTLFITDTVT